tara:strand:- start:30 stop:725 length:696 start_codon:yes stop_codon:yes gene_type:complete
MRNKLFIILLTFFAFQLYAEKLDALKPSKATLTMKNGDMEVWLEKKENNIWEMGSLVDGGRVFQRKEVSIFELKEDSVIPLEHKMSMKILFKKIKASARFNWENLTLDYGEGKDKGSLKLIDGTLGPATAQLKMRLDLRSMDINALPEKIKYVVYYRGEIKERTYSLKGFEDTETPFGTFNTLRVEREFLPEEEREQIYWFAPDLDFSIVRILNTDGRKSDLLLKSLEFGD